MLTAHSYTMYVHVLKYFLSPLPLLVSLKQKEKDFTDAQEHFNQKKNLISNGIDEYCTLYIPFSRVIVINLE